MKKLMFSFMAAIMLCAAMPVQIQAAENRAIPSTPRNAPATAETRAMEARLYEIRDMNISAMGKAEKKQLRNEVKAIKSDLKAAGQGVYLSVGAIILIVLLLILLL
jgi:hypothetical protein